MVGRGLAEVKEEHDPRRHRHPMTTSSRTSPQRSRQRPEPPRARAARPLEQLSMRVNLRQRRARVASGRCPDYSAQEDVRRHKRVPAPWRGVRSVSRARRAFPEGPVRPLQAAAPRYEANRSTAPSPVHLDRARPLASATLSIAKLERWAGAPEKLRATRQQRYFSCAIDPIWEGQARPIAERGLCRTCRRAAFAASRPWATSMAYLQTVRAFDGGLGHVHVASGEGVDVWLTARVSDDL